MNKYEYKILNKSLLVEELISIENSNRSLFEGNSILFKNYIEKLKKAYSRNDIKLDENFKAMFANGFKESVSDSRLGRKLLNVDTFLSTGEELASKLGLPADRWAKETRKNYVKKVFNTCMRELKPIAHTNSEGKKVVYRDDEKNSYYFDDNYLSSALHGNLASWYANEIKIPTNAPDNWRKEIKNTIKDMFIKTYPRRIDESLEDMSYEDGEDMTICNIDSLPLSKEDKDLLYRYLGDDASSRLYTNGNSFVFSNWYDSFEFDSLDELMDMVRYDIAEWDKLDKRKL